MTDKRLLDPVAVSLLQAADLIDLHGWWNGKGASAGGFCAATALDTVCGFDQAVHSAAITRLGKHVGCKRITTWNDAHDQATVVAAMRAAAIR